MARLSGRLRRWWRGSAGNLSRKRGVDGGHLRPIQWAPAHAHGGRGSARRDEVNASGPGAWRCARRSSSAPAWRPARRSPGATTPFCTWAALSVLPELTGRAPVRVESLAGFLAADPAGLAEVLRAEEAWARANVPAYPPRPDALAFRPEATPPGRAGRRASSRRCGSTPRPGSRSICSCRPARRRTAGEPSPSPRSR